MSDANCLGASEHYQHWLNRVRDTHDAVRFTVGHRLHGNWQRAESVAVQVIIEMLKRPRVLNYQGLPYSGRIGSVAESILEGPPHSFPNPPDWPALHAYLANMPAQIRPIFIGAFVEGLTDGQIANRVGMPMALVISTRKAAERYLSQSAQSAKL